MTLTLCSARSLERKKVTPISRQTERQDNYFRATDNNTLLYNNRPTQGDKQSWFQRRKQQRGRGGGRGGRGGQGGRTDNNWLPSLNQRAGIPGRPTSVLLEEVARIRCIREDYQHCPLWDSTTNNKHWLQVHGRKYENEQGANQMDACSHQQHPHEKVHQETSTFREKQSLHFTVAPGPKTKNIVQAHHQHEDSQS